MNPRRWLTSLCLGAIAAETIFFSNNAEYHPYLQSSYAQYLSEGEEFKSYLITDASSEKLREIIAQFIADNELPSPS